MDPIRDGDGGGPRWPAGPATRAVPRSAVLSATRGRPVGLVAALLGRRVSDDGGKQLGRVDDLVLERGEDLVLSVVGIVLGRDRPGSPLRSVDPDATPEPPHRPDDGRSLLTELLGADVLDSRGGPLGVVTEVHAVAVDVEGRTELRLSAVTHGHRVALAWRRHERTTPWSDVLALPDPDDRAIWVRTRPAGDRGDDPDGPGGPPGVGRMGGLGPG